MTYPNTPIVPLSNLYVNGMGVSRTGTTTLSISAGQCYDSTLTYPIIVNTATTINGSVNGVNGLDAGTLANNTWYAVHAISDPSLKAFPNVGYLLSTSAVAPALPFGYGLFRRIGWALTNGSAQFLLFYASGNGSSRLYQWDLPISVLSAGVATTFAAVSLAAAMPLQSTPVFLNAAYVPAVAGNAASIRPTGSTVASTTSPILITGQVATVKVTPSMIQILPLLSVGNPSVDYQVVASDSLTLFVAAWTDIL